MSSQGNTQACLLSAVKANDVEEVERLISEGAKLVEEQAKPNQDQVIHASCVKPNSLEVLDLLLQNGVDVELRGANGHTPLVRAASAGRLEIVEYLLKTRCADANSKDINGKTPLHMATRYGCKSTTEILCKHGAITDAQDNKGVTPLCYSSSFGALDITCALLKAKADPNIADNTGNGPLHYASRKGHIKVVTLLIKHLADINAKNNEGCTPLFWAAAFNHIEVTDLLIKHEADVDLANNKRRTPLFKAISQKHIELASKLALLQKDIDVTDETGMTALHQCVLKNLFKPFKVLLIRKADITITAEKYGTPLNIAAAQNNTMFLIRLLTCSQGVFSEHGNHPVAGTNEFFIKFRFNSKEDDTIMLCSTNDTCMMTMMAYWGNKKAAAYLESTFRGTPGYEKVSNYSIFHTLAYNGNVTPHLKKFVDSGGDLDFRGGHRGATVLLEAIAGRSRRAVKLFYNHGCNMKAVDLEGNSAMHHASSRLYVRMVKMLLDLGFEPDNKNVKQGDKTPLVMTLASLTPRLSKLKKRQTKKKITKMLLEAGADPNVRVDNNTGCPLMFAVSPPCGNALPGAVRSLLKAGANPNGGIYVRHMGASCSPLQLAMDLGDSATVAELIKAGANHRGAKPKLQTRRTNSGSGLANERALRVQPRLSAYRPAARRRPDPEGDSSSEDGIRAVAAMHRLIWGNSFFDAIDLLPRISDYYDYSDLDDYY